MSIETKTINPDEPRKSPATLEFENLIEQLANAATTAVREYIAKLVDPNGTVRIDELTPAHAAVLRQSTMYNWRSHAHDDITVDDLRFTITADNQIKSEARSVFDFTPSVRTNNDQENL